MKFEFGPVEIVVPGYFIPYLTDRAYDKGFAVAEKLIEAEAMLYTEGDFYVDINETELLELTTLLVEVVD